MKNFFIDFGFKPLEYVNHEQTIIKNKQNQGDNTEDKEYIEHIILNKTNSDFRIVWSVLIYIFFSLGIFLRRAVNFPDPLHGINTFVFKWGIIGASFIIGLAVLAPLLRIISKFHKGRLSWQHCLTAFTIGFFSDLTFEFLINNFINILKT